MTNNDQSENTGKGHLVDTAKHDSFKAMQVKFIVESDKVYNVKYIWYICTIKLKVACRVLIEI